MTGLHICKFLVPSLDSCLCCVAQHVLARIPELGLNGRPVLQYSCSSEPQRALRSLCFVAVAAVAVDIGPCSHGMVGCKRHVPPALSDQA